MRTLIFDESLSGHHLEYLHHYYMGACERPDEEYVICVPQKEFESKKDKYDWPEATNITFEWLDQKYCDAILNCSGMKSGFIKAKAIARYAKASMTETVLLTNFMSTIPFILWFMHKGIVVKGIVYRIYLYNERNSIRAKIRYSIDNFCYRLMALSRVMDKVFILNDQKSADHLNKIHHTSKFTFLPDPVPQVDMSLVRNIRQQFEIPMENKVFLHFGGLAKRKGTLDILNAIIASEQASLTNKTFIFAGKVYPELHEEFYSLVSEAKQKAHILVFDEFCPYDFLYNLCYSCDVILTPYHQTNLSSGLLGYAAVFHKPVIGPSDGLIGRLIKDFNMGLAISGVSADSLARSFKELVEWSDHKYAEQNDVNEFIKTILE